MLLFVTDFVMKKFCHDVILRLNIFLCILLSCLLVSSCSTFKLSTRESNSVFFSNPKCENYIYKSPVLENDGDVRLKKLGNSYCTFKDSIDGKNTIPVLASLEETLLQEDFDIDQIDIASYYLFLDQFADMICKKAAHDEFGLRLVIQRKSKNTPYDFVSDYFYKTINKCMKNRIEVIEVGCDVFWGECNRSSVNTMHNKMIIIRGKNNQRNVSYIWGGSGNFANKMKTNFDDIILSVVPRGHKLDNKHNCIMEIFIRYGNLEVPANKQEKYFRECLNADGYEKEPKHNLQVYFMPFERQEYLSLLMKSIEGASKIDAAFQVLADKGILNSLISASNRGAMVRIITDNSWYYLTTPGVSAVAKRLDLSNKRLNQRLSFIRPLIEQRMAIRFMETNFDTPPSERNSMHLRFIITTNQSTKTVFTGSSHFKYGAFKKNYENQYVVHDPLLVSKYNDFFDELWLRALPWKDMPANYQITDYAYSQGISID